MFQSLEEHVSHNTTTKTNRSLEEEGYFEQIWTILIEKINVT